MKLSVGGVARERCVTISGTNVIVGSCSMKMPHTGYEAAWLGMSAWQLGQCMTRIVAVERTRPCRQDRRVPPPPKYGRLAGRFKPQALAVSSAYPAASSIRSCSVGSEGSRSAIHPSPYGSALINSGWSTSFSLTATTVPAIGANTSDTDLVDSISLRESPLEHVFPTSGSST